MPSALRVVPVAVGGAAGALSGIADSRVFVRMARSRLWIAVIGVLLTGVVALNVAALSLTASGTAAERQAAQLEQEISELASLVTAGASNERLARVAARLGLVVPDPAAIRYLGIRPANAARAAERLSSGELTAAAPAIAAGAEPLAGSEATAEPAAVAPAPEAEAPAPAQAAPEPAPTAATAIEPAQAPVAGEGASGGLTGP